MKSIYFESSCEVQAIFYSIVETKNYKYRETGLVGQFLCN